MTLTNEPFQPVRLYYSIPDRASVSARLRTLQCLVEAAEEQCWQWLFHAEAASLRFGGGYEDVPLVEDFPLAPEEETSDFRHLTFTLDQTHPGWNFWAISSAVAPGVRGVPAQSLPSILLDPTMTGGDQRENVERVGFPCEEFDADLTEIHGHQPAASVTSASCGTAFMR